MKFKSNNASMEAKAQDNPPRTIRHANPPRDKDSMISLTISQIFVSFFLKVITMKKKIPTIATGKIPKNNKCSAYKSALAIPRK